MPGPEGAPDKASALRRHHALNPRPGRVADPAFSGEGPFFDPRDLVQVKYEMLRRVREDGQAVAQASAAFGFSRPSFYEAQAAFTGPGLPGLLPQRPGPRRAHKLTDEVLDELEAARRAQPSLNSAALARIVEERFGLRVHPRSVERALARRGKGGFPQGS
ncbi:MAG: helix-turn-helix domain-containing protein [Acidimicrobiales bacterium]